MPDGTLDRRAQGVDVHLAAAAEYIAIAESGDAEQSAYEHAADEIIAAQQDDPTLSLSEIDRRLERGKDYAGRLVRWRTSSATRRSPFGGPEHRVGSDNAATKRAARERPEDFARAFDEAPPEAKRQIAEQISRDPEVRSQARKRDSEAEDRQKPSPIPPRDDSRVFNFESRLVGARRYLRDALDLVNGIEQPGDDEDILELIGMLRQMVDVVDESYRSGKSLDQWAWELYERSAD